MNLAEALDQYTQAPDDLEALVASLSEDALDARRSTDEWTTRQIVHHLADGEALWITPIKMGLIEPGYNYRHNQWIQEKASPELQYETRGIATSLALFRAQRAHLARILESVPNAWDRHVEFNWLASGDERKTQPVTVAQMIEMQIRHAADHMAEIRANLGP